MVTLPDALALRLESLAGEALQAMEAANAVADEPIYTSSSLSAAFATLEDLKATLRAQVPNSTSGDTMSMGKRN
jgi:hypothetical protein